MIAGNRDTVEWEAGRLTAHVGELFREVASAPVATPHPFFPAPAADGAGGGSASEVVPSPQGQLSLAISASDISLGWGPSDPGEGGGGGGSIASLAPREEEGCGGLGG